MMLPTMGFPAYPSAVALRPRWKSFAPAAHILTRQLLPDDAQGTSTLTLQNIAGGSAWRIELLSDGSLVDSGVVAGGGFTNLPIVTSYYGIGSPLNSVRIKVRKGSAAPKYQPFETQATLSAAAQSVFIAQIPDPFAA